MLGPAMKARWLEMALNGEVNLLLLSRITKLATIVITFARITVKESSDGLTIWNTERQ